MKGRFKYVISSALCLLLFFLVACKPPETEKYVVVFMPNITGAIVENVPGDKIVEEGEKVTEPTPAPTCSGYSFGGWYTEQACINKFDFDTPITANMVTNKNEFFLYAEWKADIVAYHDVYFDLNYDTAEVVPKQSVADGQFATIPSPAPSRGSGWRFEGWYTSAAGTTEFDFSTPIKEETILFAKWSELNIGEVSFTIDWNYIGAPSVPLGNYNRVYSISEVIPSAPPIDMIPVRPKVVDPTGYIYDKVYEYEIPADPSDWQSWVKHEVYEYEFELVGWSTEPDGDADFIDWGGSFTDNLTLYAQWRYMHTFEAEYVDLSNFVGNSVSGNATGREGVLRALNGGGSYPDPYASNGYFMSYLYKPNLAIWFDITSDRNTTAVFWVRMSGEMSDGITFSDSQYTITINNNKIDYGTINIPVFGPYIQIGAAEHFPFRDYIGIEVPLERGNNNIVLTTTNSDMMGGQLPSTAPMVDCIKFDTIARLTWTYGPQYYNLGGFPHMGEEWWL